MDGERLLLPAACCTLIHPRRTWGCGMDVQQCLVWLARQVGTALGKLLLFSRLGDP